jgi:Fis family transcriptional regulator, factor for inversion stimulation protein
MTDALGTLVFQMYRGGILYSEALNEFKKTFIATVLRENNCNQIQAARQLYMHRNTLGRLIVQLELDMTRLREPRRRPANPASRISSRKRSRTA